MDRRAFLSQSMTAPLLGASLSLGAFSLPPFASARRGVDLSRVRDRITSWYESLLDRGGPYGCYRGGFRKRPDLYSACDMAILRTIMGEDLTRSLKDEQRTEWIDHINSYANPRLRDGSYFDTHGHSLLHANGMVIGALGALGGKQRYPVKLYDDFREIEQIGPWLEKIDWARQWGASHLFWGGIHCFSMSSTCSQQWRDTVIDWLNGNIDEETGWWRKGIPHSDRHQPLGGSVHILPIYQHHGYDFPWPGAVIDSVLDLQLPAGRWLESSSIHVMGYLELDALYALSYMSSLVPDHRKGDIMAAVGRYAALVTDYWSAHWRDLLTLHPHQVLAAVGTFGLLQHFLPQDFPDDRTWTDIFSDVRFYNTAGIEVL